MINSDKNMQFVSDFWEKSIIPALMAYVRIPNKSPAFDPDWKANGHMDKAVKLIQTWCKENALPDMSIDIVQLENRTPVLFIEIPGQNNNETVLLYGHLDKQPEMSGWDADLSPWQPLLRDGKLYGRGSADDGYSTFASLAAIKSLKAQNIPHARCVILIEACEESGSYDLPFYIDALEKRIGKPSLIVCLDSGCGNYEQLWLTTSLRGLTGGLLTIDVLKQGIHSGVGSGVVPSCMMVLRQLLSRIESEKTGEILLKELFVEIPEERIEQAKDTATVLGHHVYDEYPFVTGVKPTTENLHTFLLNRSWKPALSVVGCKGLPLPDNAGNVTLPSLAVKLSMRLAPTSNAEKAAQLIKKTLETDPPYGAKISYTITEQGTGWDAPKTAPWLIDALNKTSQHYFGKTVMYTGEGGSIPFMNMLGKKFPQAQFVITGVLGPESNAHGPNEFLHIDMGKRLTACIAEIIAHHYTQF